MEDILEIDVVNHGALIACAYRCLRVDCEAI
jgi:hypothetical protein